MARPRLDENEYTKVKLFQRDDFLKRFWRYEPGEHVTIIGATGSGKTHLSYQLLGKTLRKGTKDDPGITGVVLVMKPRDATVTKWSRQLGLKRVSTWPPSYARRKYDNPLGWVLWPKLGNYDTDNETLRREFDHCFRESYSQASQRASQPRIIFADEVVGISEDLKPKRRGDPDLKEGLKAFWMRGRSLEVGLWAATQRPYEAPQLAYQAPQHVFLAMEPDERNRLRLGELSGFNSAFIRTIVDPDLGPMKKHQFLYLNRGNQTMGIIDR